jgi:PAS domain S-box-containing protein
MEVQNAQHTILFECRKPISLLYVDDDPGLLEICKLFLEQSGQIHVDLLSSAQTALEKLKSCTYDAIISDYQMPGMDGITFLKTLRSQGNFIPFILFTGRGREEIVIEALNNGADFYLQKGGDPESQFAELEHKIKLVVEQRKIKNELVESQRRFTDLIDFLPDATFAIDLEGKVIAWNRAIEDLTGVVKESIVGTGNYSYALPFYGERHPILIDLMLCQNPEIERQYLHVKKKSNKIIADTHVRILNGKKDITLWGIASPLYDTKDTIVGAIESIRDITDLKKAEEVLVESEQRYRNVVEDQTEFICRFLPDGTHVFVNEAYCRYFNREHNKIIGKRFTPRIPDEDLVLVRSHFASLTHEMPIAHIEHRIIMPSGEIRWQRWSDRVIFNPDGRVVEYQSVGRDITEQKQLEESLRQTNKKLNLLNNITCHDILNQLTSLLAYLELTGEKISDPEALDFLKKEIHAVNKIQTLIKFSRYYLDLGVNTPDWLNLREVCMRAIPGREGITVTCLSGDLDIYADPLLEKAFSTQFDNVISHGEHVTAITVSYRKDPGPGGVTITVEDNGAGIPDDEKEQIFKQGYGKHNGLGLFCLREILLITGITIRETGVWGEGARFEIRVPPGGFRDASSA